MYSITGLYVSLYDVYIIYIYIYHNKGHYHIIPVVFYLFRIAGMAILRLGKMMDITDIT